MKLCVNFLLTVLLCLTGSLSALAQLEVSYPFPRMVVQRNSDNKAPLHIAGTYSIPVDRIEVRLTPALKNHGRPTDWLLLQNEPKNGAFEGTIQAEGGWYILDVRGMRDGRMVSLTQVERVGIGEVFLISGQSNAAGVPNLGSISSSERVVGFNRNNTYFIDNGLLLAPTAPFPVPTFTSLAADTEVFPAGRSSWCWGQLGDMIADRFGVPVAYFNASWPGTIAENWSVSSNGRSALNIWIGIYWPPGLPYSNLQNTLQCYNSLFGLRAVLWHHGESDAIPVRTTETMYARLVQELINSTRRDFSSNLTWVIARNSVSHATSVSIPSIINAQNALINTPGNNVWAGPNTDSIQVPRPDHGHFENIKNGLQGITKFAASWNQFLTDDFFKKTPVSQPTRFLRTGLVPAEVPAGSTFLVPTKKLGFADKVEINIELLDSTGTFVMHLGRNTDDAVRVRIPATLAPGTYRLRAAVNNPVLPGSPSAPFQVVAPEKSARALLDIQTETEESSNEVYWLTAQEPAGSRFVVERQDSLGQFRTLGTVQARTDGALHHLYSLTDQRPLPGANRYRIRHELPGGTVHYSAVAIAGPKGDINEPFIFPNPTDGYNLTLRLPESGNWQVTLLNLNGHLKWQQSVLALANKLIALPLPSYLTSGTYLMQFQNKEFKTAKKLILLR